MYSKSFSAQEEFSGVLVGSETESVDSAKSQMEERLRVQGFTNIVLREKSGDCWWLDAIYDNSPMSNGTVCHPGVKSGS
jgi:hypothetical protein